MKKCDWFQSRVYLMSTICQLPLPFIWTRVILFMILGFDVWGSKQKKSEGESFCGFFAKRLFRSSPHDTFMNGSGDNFLSHPWFLSQSSSRKKNPSDLHPCSPSSFQEPKGDICSGYRHSFPSFSRSLLLKLETKRNRVGRKKERKGTPEQENNGFALAEEKVQIWPMEFLKDFQGFIAQNVLETGEYILLNKNMVYFICYCGINWILQN